MLGQVELCQLQLKSVLSYNPETGVFVWTINSKSGKPGRVAGSLSNGYRVVPIHERFYTAHRLAWLYVHGYFPSRIDHINGDRDDNRIANLRIADASQNGANKRRPENNTSGAKGVQKIGGGKYAAFITVRGKQKCVGKFDTLQEASDAYLAAAKEGFGEFAARGDEFKPVVYHKPKPKLSRGQRSKLRKAKAKESIDNSLKKILGKRGYGKAARHGHIAPSDSSATGSNLRSDTRK